ncbi:lipocalin-like domain-containing protein [Streptomyces sp. SP17KL33]|uniref:lipocalin-like domain-containing protein n=1 Tax=Streptomyces sp. SP17KL33 TaxID=3002534 RepID=UPI002E795A0B|nr:lipocalin-like domain-containing protein [Streptomyces sp. SP17KL33]MEE1832684.1 lipocalin-like domain-containing protein [Streptomyces sp. SP17KL33]
MSLPDTRAQETRGAAFDPVGVWHLVAYHDVDDDGGVSDGPLGSTPRGMLLYTADGHMAVSMMRAPDGPDGPERGDGGSETFMGYAGRWRLEGGRMVHEVAVSAHPFMVGTRQIRHLRVDGGDLVLTGVAQGGEHQQRRILRWRRAG